jgi:hypothetical protein
LIDLEINNLRAAKFEIDPSGSPGRDTIVARA